MSRLTVVSNRLPVALQRDAQSRWTAARSPGGLVSALDPVLRRKGGRWIGWAGVAAEDCDAATAAALLAELAGDFDLVPVPLSRRDVELYYHGFANSTIWPLFHGLAERCRLDTRYFIAYGEANRRFARRLAADMEDGEVVWVHDYQLMHVGQVVRRERPGACLGFFLHIPFPRPDHLRRLPWWREVMDALLSYDLVGLQTARDLRSFAACVAELVGVEPVREGGLLRVPLGSRTVTAASFPIGIDADGWSQLAASPEVERLVSELRRQIGSQAVLLGVDRLDYTKGLLERIGAYERLLERHPELRGRVVLVQVVVPSREAVPDYAALRAELDRRIGRVSGRFGRPGWTPIRYVYGGLPAPELAALYRMADAALVTPVCDGMNLVAKEYCAAQVDPFGTLVLGEQAGAAEQLGPAGAVLVSPGDVERTAAAIHQALTMDVHRRRASMESMRRVVADATVFRWADAFLAELERARAAGPARRRGPLRAGGRRASTAIGTPPAGVPAHNPSAPDSPEDRPSAAT